MAKENITGITGIGVREIPPYLVWWIRGNRIKTSVEYETREEAEAKFHTLRNDDLADPPIALVECFRLEGNPRFELIRIDGWIRLWKSTETRWLDGAAIDMVRYHVTGKDELHCLHMPDLETSIASFELDRAAEHAAYMSKYRAAHLPSWEA